jgi:O-acetyl-ADP-ribose deacetylase (regulator of RNase III)
MKVILSDISGAVVNALRVQFAKYPDIQVLERSVCEIDADAVICPGNSFGYMDGGVALALSEKFGFALEDSVRAAIRERFGGEMLVGQAEVFTTGSRPAWLIYAPTLRTSFPIADTVNVYLAARAAFRAALAFNRAEGAERIGTIAVPGMGTGKGNVHPFIGARQLRWGYEEAIGLRGPGASKNLSRLIRREKKLREIPGSATAESDSEE